MTRAVALLSLLALAGCSSAQTRYQPARAVPGELVLRYDDGFEAWADGQKVASSPGYSGLAEYVRCVPDARRHAEAAQSWGSGSVVLSGVSIGLAVGGLGGLAGLHFKDKNDAAMAGLLVGGLVVEAAAIALGASSLNARAQAHGHALDAVSFYNDGVGFSGGGGCSR